MKFRFSFILALLSGVVMAQQESQFAGAFQQAFMYNPAAGGIADVAQVDLVTRLQWIGANGPKTFQLSGYSVVGIGNSSELQPYNEDKNFMYGRPRMNTGNLKHVFGGRVLSDQIGVFNKTAVYGTYAVHLPINRDFNIGAGAGIGWGNNRINSNKVILTDYSDETYLNALSGNGSQNFLDLNAGLIFYGKGFTFGASVMQVFKNKMRFDQIETNSFYAPHIYLQSSYSIRVGSHSIEPGIIAKFVPKGPVNIDFGARFLYKNAAWLGVYARTSNNLVVQIGANLIGNIYLNYAFEYGYGKIRLSNSGTHEIQLGIYIGKNNKKASTKEKEGQEDSKKSGAEETETK